MPATANRQSRSSWKPVVTGRGPSGDITRIPMLAVANGGGPPSSVTIDPRIDPSVSRTVSVTPYAPAGGTVTNVEKLALESRYSPGATLMKEKDPSTPLMAD